MHPRRRHHRRGAVPATRATTALSLIHIHSGGFIYIGGTGYRYNYGGTGAVGQKVSGGTYTAPDSGTTVKTQSGKTVQRGGFGVSNSGKSGGS